MSLARVFGIGICLTGLAMLSCSCVNAPRKEETPFSLFGENAELAGRGPSKPRLRELLSECRVHLREYVRIVRESEKNCPSLPEQRAGMAAFGDGGQ